MTPAEAPSDQTQAPAAIDTVFDELKRTARTASASRISSRGGSAVHTTVDERMQIIVNEALETGLARYERRHPEATG